MPQDLSLTPRPSQEQIAWKRALLGGDDALLHHLASIDHPAAALLELETYINGLYRVTQLLPWLDTTDLKSKIERVLPLVSDIRSRLGWRIRDFDLGLLRMIRRSSALSPVLGAGVSMGAGAPSWSDLVRLMLEETLEKGVEFYEYVPAPDNPAQPPIEFLPDGTVRIGETGRWRFEQNVKDVKRYSMEQEQVARNILAEVKTKGNKTDVETLMGGAQICYDLCGQHLFRLLTSCLYKHAKAPSETHQAIAELASMQTVPDRGSACFPGWEAIITYNFDALMSEALAAQQIPHVAWAMKGDELKGDPDELARNSQWYQSVFHLHGYTPQHLFLITNIHYVFSTSQYLTTYKGPQSTIFDVVFRSILANPVHIALYIGCSFADEAMNGLLRAAFSEYPGRYHYALLQWPHNRKEKEPTPNEIQAESAKYLEFGVRPVWFDGFSELPNIIRTLQ